MMEKNIPITVTLSAFLLFVTADTHVCSQSFDSGTCTNFILNWFYDASYGGCSRFHYGGCEGNGNRFISKEECEDVCVTPIHSEDLCRLPSVKGSCNNINQHWYYDLTYQGCRPFTYGGCLGNANNFESRELCEEKCKPLSVVNPDAHVCSQSFDSGPCTNFTLNWFYDASYGGCSRFHYGGCEGNGNRFISKEECEDVCVTPIHSEDLCRLPSVKGSCNNINQHWYYDLTYQGCRPFTYGGCLGNANNFESRELCEEKCKPQSVVNPDAPVCSQLVDSGPCRNYTVQWYYDSSNGRCSRFPYGGCEGNGNRFNSKEECENICVSSNTTVIPGQWYRDLHVCSQSFDSGPCTNFTVNWFYDSSYGGCSRFHYGGCEGNGNRFVSKEECERVCVAPDNTEDLCRLPKVKGSCSNLIFNWHYNPSYQSCLPFTYGGCLGNANKFESRELCEEKCKPQSHTTVNPDN